MTTGDQTKKCEMSTQNKENNETCTGRNRSMSDNACANSSETSPPLEDYIINPLLAYIHFAIQGGNAENVRNAAVQHFSIDQIIEAKDALWNRCGVDKLGEKARRKDSSSRSEKEAHVQDVITALQRLDREASMPTILIPSSNLDVIPRSHQACIQMRVTAFKCKCKCAKRFKCKCKCKCTAFESNANANASAQHLNQMQMHLNQMQMQMHLNQMQMQMQTI